MRVPLEALVSFSAVAEAGSVSRAADCLHLSQPALSNQLRRLREVCGQPLLQRRGRGVTLTPAGQALRPYADAVAVAARQASAHLTSLHDHAPAELRLGVCWTLSVSLPGEVHQRLGGLGGPFALTVSSGPSRALLEAVDEGLLDAAVTADAHHLPASLEARRIGGEKAALLVACTHPLAQQAGPVTLPQLTRERLVWPSQGAAIRLMTEQALREAHLTLPPGHFLGGYLAVKEAVLGGMGITVAPPSLFRRELDASWVRALAVPGLNVEMEYVLASRPRALLRPGVLTLLDLTWQAARTLYPAD